MTSTRRFGLLLTLAACWAATSASRAAAQIEFQIQPVFKAGVIDAPGILAMGLARRGSRELVCAHVPASDLERALLTELAAVNRCARDDGGRICGRDSNNMAEEKTLLDLEAAGRCGAAGVPAARALLSVRNESGGIRGDVPNARAPGVSGAAVAGASAAFLRFTPSVERRRANLTRFIDRTRATDPATGARLARIVADRDLIAAMGAQLAPFGLRTDDVADAYAVWSIQAWQVAHADTSTPNRATALAVRAQAARALAAVPALRSANDAVKQEAAEALLLQAALLSASAESAVHDPSTARGVAQAARTGARAAGLDVDALTLTERGFVSAR